MLVLDKISNAIPAGYENIDAALNGLKEIISFLIEQPIILLFLGFLVMSIVIKQALFRQGFGIFSNKASSVIAIVLSLFGAGIVAANLEAIGEQVAWIVIIGLPVAVVGGLVLSARRNQNGQ